MNKINLLKRTSGLVLFSLCLIASTSISFPSFAQDEELIKPLEEKEIKMSKSLTDYQTKLKANVLIKEINFVKIGSLSKVQKNGKLTFSIPGYPKKVNATATYVEYLSDNNYKWHGKTIDGLGDIILLANNGEISAHISLPDGIYEIYTTPEGHQVVATIDLIKANDIGCGVSDETHDRKTEPSQDRDDFSNGRLNPCPTVRPIRALFLVSQAARNANPNINAAVDLSISQFNSCVYNSGVSSAATIELAGIQDFSFTETSNASNDVDRLAANSTSQALRNNFLADIVVLLTNGSYGGTRGIVADIGPINNRAYSIVQVNSASAHKTCAHEIAHLYGGKHQETSLDTLWAKAYIIKNWLGIVKGCTILVGGLSSSDAAGRLLNFSNPSVRVNGFATGTSNNNNARRVIETFATVRSFRADPPHPFSVYVLGPSEVTSSGFRTYEAYYSCGSSPYTFTWETSTDGVNYILVGSTTDIYNHPFYPQTPNPYWFYARVTARDGSGATSTSFYRTYVDIPGFNSLTTVNADSVTVFPNPATDITQLQYSLSEESEVKVEILDNTTNVVKIINIGVEKVGTHIVTVDTQDLQPGVYLCRLRTNGSTVLKRIIVNNSN